MDPLDPTITAIVLGVAFLLSCVALGQAHLRSVLAWACVLGFWALAWDAISVA